MGLRDRESSGFTLLEAILAMTLMGVIIGIGAIFYFNAQDKKILREAAVQIEAMSSRGHAMAVLHQKPFWLRFQEGRVELVGADIRRKTPEEEEGGPPPWMGEEEEQGNETVYDTYVGDAVVAIRRWGTREDDWIEPKEEQFTTWQFQSTGLCEPVSIRLTTDKSWIIMYMNPLTARVDEEDMSIE